MKPIIQIKNIGKKYKIKHYRGGYIALRDVLMNILRSPLKFAQEKVKSVANSNTKEDFWALKNVTFDIFPGEVVGIIGHNGAGKSTLLKILTGITPPSEGEITMQGRVASLLEVGTGFHPELSGRENIFLNGAILGMTRKEIANKFDKIVLFAGVEKFLDTPVKYYSSGMYVRLAFSVAAHMEPDILLVDEVLAVGDAEFQKKCLGKMEEVTKQDGRTILLVSHNMAAIQQLCKKTILLQNGQIHMIGKTEDVLVEYLNTKGQLSKEPLMERKNRQGSQRVIFTKCDLVNKEADRNNADFAIEYKNTTGKLFENIKISLEVRDQFSNHLASITNTVLEQKIDLLPDGGIIHLEIINLNLESGVYYADIFLATDTLNSEILDCVQNACSFEINNNGFYPTNRLPPVPSKLLFDFKYY